MSADLHDLKGEMRSSTAVLGRRELLVRFFITGLLGILARKGTSRARR